jgi:hypothetical protein
MAYLSNPSKHSACLYCDCDLIQKKILVKPKDYDRRDYFNDFTPGIWFECPSCGRITKFINNTPRLIEIKKIYIDGILFWVAKNQKKGPNFGKSWLYVVNKSSILKIPDKWFTKDVDMLNFKLNNRFDFSSLIEGKNYTKYETITWFEDNVAL